MENPLYRQVLGAAFDALPAQLRALHGETTERSWEGVARVQRGTGMVSRILGNLFGFPPADDQMPVKVQFIPHHGGEKWVRTFGKKSFSSIQSLGIGRNEHLLTERFGLVEVALALVVKEERLYLIPRRWSLLGLPLPSALLPSGNSFEAQVNGKFHFDVEISAPFVGLIAAYQGQLEPSRET